MSQIARGSYKAAAIVGQILRNRKSKTVSARLRRNVSAVYPGDVLPEIPKLATQAAAQTNTIQEDIIIVSETISNS